MTAYYYRENNKYYVVYPNTNSLEGVSEKSFNNLKDAKEFLSRIK